MAGICPLILCSIILALCKNDCCLSTKTQNAQVCFEFLHTSVPLKLIFVSPLGLVKETSGLDSLLAALESTGYVHLFLATRIHYAFIYFDHDVWFFFVHAPFRVWVLLPSPCHLFLSLKPMMTKGSSPVQGGCLLMVQTRLVSTLRAPPFPVHFRVFVCL